MAGEAKNAFNGTVVAKLIALLDSPEDNEAAAALYRLRAILKKSGKRFFEAVETRDYKAAIWKSFEPDCLRDYFSGTQNGGHEAQSLRDQLAQREAELAELRNRLQEAERDGQEIAVRAEQIIKGLQLEIATLQKAGPLCRPCELKRRSIAVLLGLIILALWFRIKVPGDADEDLTWLGIVLALSPFTGVIGNWQWSQFKRKHAWVAWNDNGIYRAIAERWNGALEAVKLR